MQPCLCAWELQQRKKSGFLMIWLTQRMRLWFCVFCFVLFFTNRVAFQLKKCQPPPAVPQAEMLMEDEDFEIGNVLLIPREAVSFAAFPPPHPARRGRTQE